MRLCYASFHRCGSSIENAQQFPCYYSQVINSLIEVHYAVERKTSSSHHFTRKIEIKLEEKRDYGIEESKPTSSSGISLQIAADSFIHPFPQNTSLNTFTCQHFQVPQHLLPFRFAI